MRNRGGEERRRRKVRSEEKKKKEKMKRREGRGRTEGAPPSRQSGSADPKIHWIRIQSNLITYSARRFAGSALGHKVSLPGLDRRLEYITIAPNCPRQHTWEKHCARSPNLGPLLLNVSLPQMMVGFAFRRRKRESAKSPAPTKKQRA